MILKHSISVYNQHEHTFDFRMAKDPNPIKSSCAGRIGAITAVMRKNCQAREAEGSLCFIFHALCRSYGINSPEYCSCIFSG